MLCMYICICIHVDLVCVDIYIYTYIHTVKSLICTLPNPAEPTPWLPSDFGPLSGPVGAVSAAARGAQVSMETSNDSFFFFFWWGGGSGIVIFFEVV